jgi:adenylate cyclase
VIYTWTNDVEKTREESGVLIEEASEKVGDDPTALTALATATTLLLGDLDRASHFVERALTLDPNNAWAWSRRGFMEAYSGHGEAAIAAFEHALRLSPLDPFSFNSHNGIGFANFVLGRYDRAIEWTQRGMRERAGMTWAHRDLAAYYALAGRIDEARRSIAELVKTRPGLTIAKVMEALRFVEPAVLARYAEGLRLAGLPA